MESNDMDKEASPINLILGYLSFKAQGKLTAFHRQ